MRDAAGIGEGGRQRLGSDWSLWMHVLVECSARSLLKSAERYGPLLKVALAGVSQRRETYVSQSQ